MTLNPFEPVEVDEYAPPLGPAEEWAVPFGRSNDRLAVMTVPEDAPPGVREGIARRHIQVATEFQRMLQFPTPSVGALAFDSVTSSPLTLNSAGVVGSGGERGGTTINNTTKNVTYVAAEHQSHTSEEALYAALGSPRVRD
ncbi:hypothetical protein [Microbacterium sp. che218]|uniref:hypothetical protein n=1 Tax=Microbacterium sp. che218 TaxID=3140649 RepID=UPI003366731D